MAKKAESKAWVDSKKAKKRGEEPQSETRRESAVSEQTLSPDADGQTTALKKTEKGLEVAGRGEAEAAGAGPSTKEALEQGPVNVKPR